MILNLTAAAARAAHTAAVHRAACRSVMVMCAKLHKTTCIDSEVIESAMASAAHPALAVEAAARKLAEQLGLQVPPSP